MGGTGSKTEGDKSQLESLKKIQTNMGKIQLTNEENISTFNSSKTSIDTLVKNIEKPPDCTNSDSSGPNASASGPNATASGPNATASGPNATASGPNATASGLNSGGKRKSRRRRRPKQHHKSTRSLRLI